MSERNAHEVIRALISAGGLTADKSRWTLDSLREVYIRDLREKAAGRYGSVGESLAEAKTQDALAGAQLKLLQIEEKAGRLVPADAVERELRAMVTAARAELLALPEKLIVEIKALYGVDVDADLIRTHVAESLNHLARSHRAEPGAHDDEGSAGVAAAS